MKTLNEWSKAAVSIRDVLTLRARRLSVGWLWLVALIALPDCSFTGREPPTYTAVFCDIQKPLFGRHCASDAEKSRGIRLSDAALALNRGETIDVALDDSPAALTRCGGEPEALLFRGAFPEGQPVCVPDSVSPLTACAVPCQQYFGQVNDAGSLVPEYPPDPSVVAFCAQEAVAHLSTNVPRAPLGYPDGCTKAGKLLDDFVDTRYRSEPVDWDLAGQIGVSPYESVDSDHAVKHHLARLALTSPPVTNPPFDAGAASMQWITHGDGHVEFSAAENTLSHILGLSEISVGPLGCALNSCDDNDPSVNDIDFGISLNKDGLFYVIESGTLVSGPDLNGSFGTYGPGDRFRVKVKDNLDAGQTATISYARVLGSCPTGSWCPDSVFHVSQVGPGHYPLRVDTSFREYGARLTDIRVVRIR